MARTPRRARLTAPGVPLHRVQRGNSRDACCHGVQDCRPYPDWLQEYPAQAGCAVHGYVLMANQVNLLVTPPGTYGAGEMMKASAGAMYSTSIGPVAAPGPFRAGRFRSCPVGGGSCCSGRQMQCIACRTNGRARDGPPRPRAE